MPQELPTRNPFREFGSFILEAANHWLAFLGGSVPVIILGMIANLGWQLKPWIWVVALCVGLVMACFLAWRDERRKLDRLAEEKAALEKSYAQEKTALTTRFIYEKTGLLSQISDKEALLKAKEDFANKLDVLANCARQGDDLFQRCIDSDLKRPTPEEILSWRLDAINAVTDLDSSLSYRFGSLADSKPFPPDILRSDALRMISERKEMAVLLWPLVSSLRSIVLSLDPIGRLQRE